MMERENTDTVVYVVDDDDELRKAMAFSLQSAGYKVASFAAPSDFLRAVCLDSPGCVVIDLRLPEMSGLEMQRRLAAMTAYMPFIMISAYGDVASTVDAMRQGAVDFLEKPCDRARLIQAVEKALVHGEFLREQIGEEEAVAARMGKLTPRERQVLGRVVEGLLTKQIATEFGLSPKTVEVHRSRIMAKLRIESITQLGRIMMIDQRARHRRGEPTPETALVSM